MITRESIEACQKESLSDLLPTLQPADLNLLVSWLSEKEDNFRYKCFLLLQQRSQKYPDVYPYWDTFCEKLTSSNSYQRSIGLMLIAENVRWDSVGKFNTITDSFLSFCDDEKPITVRQCIQSLLNVVPYNSTNHTKIVDKLLSIDLMQRKETQRKLLLVDIITVLSAIQKAQADERIDRYIMDAMSGGILDDKAKKLIRSL